MSSVEGLELTFTGKVSMFPPLQNTYVPCPGTTDPISDQSAVLGGKIVLCTTGTVYVMKLKKIEHSATVCITSPYSGTVKNICTHAKTNHGAFLSADVFVLFTNYASSLPTNKTIKDCCAMALPD